MNPGETNIPESLSYWLRIATRDLAPPGPERITREISAHYAAAVESHVSQGEPEPVAHLNALEELGDAKTARRRFCKGHLTKQQEDWLEEFGHGMGSRIGLAVLLFLGFVLETALIKKLKPNQAILVCILIDFVYMVLPLVTFWRLRQPENKSSLYSVASIVMNQAALSCFALAFLAFVALMGWIDSKCLFLSLSLGQYWILLLVRSFLAWKKLRKIENPAIGTSGLA